MSDNHNSGAERRNGERRKDAGASEREQGGPGTGATSGPGVIGDDVHRTTTQTAPNISTEHQEQGDARRPSDTLDRQQDPRDGHTKTQPAPNLSTEN